MQQNPCIDLPATASCPELPCLAGIPIHRIAEGVELQQTPSQVHAPLLHEANCSVTGVAPTVALAGRTHN